MAPEIVGKMSESLRRILGKLRLATGGCANIRECKGNRKTGRQADRQADRQAGSSRPLVLEIKGGGI